MSGSDLVTIHHGARGERIRQLQAATNRRLIARGFASLKLVEDGICGLKTLVAVRKAAYLLGALSVNYEAVTADREISVGIQRMVRNPGLRNDKQVARGKIRLSQARAARKRRAAAAVKEHAEHGTSARSQAVDAFLARVGNVEHPAGSNGDQGGIIDTMQRYWGFGHVAWCGIAAGYHAQKFGGLAALRSDVASVALIEDHARRGDAGYGRWTSSVDGALPGSFVVIGGRGVHVAMVVEAIGNGAAKTVEGNTSFGPGGSQSNGGCIAARTRSDSEIYGCAHMDYPLAA